MNSLRFVYIENYQRRSSRCTACLPQAGILDSTTICLGNNKFVESGLFIRHASSLGGSRHPLEHIQY
jgi:hypothetical protein